MAWAPERYDLKVYRGKQYIEQFEFQDETGATLDLRERDVSVVIDATRDNPEIELTAGDGLDVDLAAGKVLMTLTGTHTTPLRGTVWAMWLDRGSTHADVLVTGNVYVIGG